MKMFRLMILVALLAGFGFALHPAATYAQDGGGDALSCAEYADGISGIVSAYTGQLDGSDGPFVGGVIFTFTFTEVDGDTNSTVRLVADPLGLTTLAGPISVPGTLSFTMPEDVDEQPAGLGYYFNSGNEGPVAIDVSCENVAGPDVVLEPGCEPDIPSQAVVGAFNTTTEIYWAPGKLTEPTLYVDQGSTFYVAGQDESEQFYKVLIACEWVWVRKDTVGPNYDEVWQGQPLPTTIVD